MSTAVAMPSEASLHTRVGETQSRDETRTGSMGRPNTDMTLSSRPRTLGLFPELLRSGLEIGHDDGEDTQYVFSSDPSGAITSNRTASSHAVTPSTAVYLGPFATRNPMESQAQEEAVQYEVTQNALKVKGNARGIKIIATQVAKTSLEIAAEYHVHVPGSEEQNHQSQGQVKLDSRVLRQNGALFLQSVTDTDSDVSQTAGRKDFYTVKQDAVEVEGEVVGGSINCSQHWR